MADVTELREVLDTLRDAGVVRAKVERGPDGKLDLLEVEFSAPAVRMAATPFVDKNGKPIDFDKGAPTLARDPDGEDEDDDEGVPADRAIERANLSRKDEKA